MTIPAVIATVKHLFIYPVKSMRGVPVAEAHLGLNGIHGDRRFAFMRQDALGRESFPWMTGREQTRMLLYRPRFERFPTPDDSDPPLRVATPDGDEFAVTDPTLQQRLEAD